MIDRRFSYYLTDAVQPFAYFQIQYKEPWEQLDHIKIDLYTEGIASTAKRRSMMIFKADNRELYSFLEEHFKHICETADRITKSSIPADHEKWIADWNEYLERRTKKQ